MKKVLFITCSVLLTVGIYAQPPGGMGGRGSGGQRGGPPRGEMPNRPASSEDKLILEHFPEIPDLTLEQREKVGSILSKEREDIEKQFKKKRTIEKEITPDISDKDLKKKQQKLEKIDKKVQDIREKSNKKIKRELSEEQYRVFIEKREEFKFRRHRPQFQGTPPVRNNDTNDERPPFPPQGGSEMLLDDF